jgi:hypothetical protein
MSTWMPSHPGSPALDHGRLTARTVTAVNPHCSNRPALAIHEHLIASPHIDPVPVAIDGACDSCRFVGPDDECGEAWRRRLEIELQRVEAGHLFHQ